MGAAAVATATAVVLPPRAATMVTKTPAATVMAGAQTINNKLKAAAETATEMEAMTVTTTKMKTKAKAAAAAA